jgi:uncharacterized membrane protein YgdD (TMEM256/DUF423 family)
MIDDSTTRWILFAAGVSGAAGVLLGSFGAHGLDTFLAAQGLDEALITKRLDQFDVGVHYHLIHSIALLALASVHSGSCVCRRWVAWMFVLGLILFSGSLYVLVLTNTPVLGAITPLGGLSWIAGWLLLAILARRVGRQPNP